MQPITIKLHRQLDGLLKGIELCQGDQHITVTTDKAGYKVPNGFRWEEVRDAIDKVVEDNYEAMLKDLKDKSEL